MIVCTFSYLAQPFRVILSGDGTGEASAAIAAFAALECVRDFRPRPNPRVVLLLRRRDRLPLLFRRRRRRPHSRRLLRRRDRSWAPSCRSADRWRTRLILGAAAGSAALWGRSSSLYRSCICLLVRLTAYDQFVSTV